MHAEVERRYIRGLWEGRVQVGPLGDLLRDSHLRAARRSRPQMRAVRVEHSYTRPAVPGPDFLAPA
jgi:hypothetical protein